MAKKILDFFLYPTSQWMPYPTTNTAADTHVCTGGSGNIAFFLFASLVTIVTFGRNDDYLNNFFSYFVNQPGGLINPTTPIALQISFQLFNLSRTSRRMLFQFLK